MVIILRLVCIKSKKDEDSFKFLKAFGTRVHELEDLEQTDLQIKQCIKDAYDTIIISDELASFSGDIITKYKNSKAVNIIITKSKRI